MDVQSPESPRRISLRLDVYPPPQVLQISGRLYHLVLAFLVVRGVTNSRVPWLHGSYSASLLLRTQPPPSRLRPLSRRDRLYDLPCSADFSMGRGGLLQLLSMSLSPCCRIPPRRDEVAVSFRFRLPMLPFAPWLRARPSVQTIFRGHIRVHFRYGPVTRRLPWGDVVDRLQSLDWDRNRARPAVGEGFPFPALSIAGRVHIPTVADVSRCPPIIPDGRISRVRFETLAFLPWAFPKFGEV